MGTEGDCVTKHVEDGQKPETNLQIAAEMGNGEIMHRVASMIRNGFSGFARLLAVARAFNRLLAVARSPRFQIASEVIMIL